MTSTSRMGHIAIKKLSVDSEVQRQTDHIWVDKLAREFKPDSAGALIVSERYDGTIVIIDGQHRALAGVRSGYNGTLPCVIYSGLEKADEAALFLTLNNSRKVSAIDRFRVRVVEGDKAANAIAHDLKSAGWIPRNGPTNHSFGAIVSLERVYEGAGVTKGPRDDLVKAVLLTITGAWGYIPQGAHQTIVSGLGTLFARLGNKVDRERLCTVLRKVPPESIVMKAKQLYLADGSRPGPAAASAICGIYNKRLSERQELKWIWK